MQSYRATQGGYPSPLPKVGTIPGTITHPQCPGKGLPGRQHTLLPLCLAQCLCHHRAVPSPLLLPHVLPRVTLAATLPCSLVCPCYSHFHPTRPAALPATQSEGQRGVWWAHSQTRPSRNTSVTLSDEEQQCPMSGQAEETLKLSCLEIPDWVWWCTCNPSIWEVSGGRVIRRLTSSLATQ